MYMTPVYEVHEFETRPAYPPFFGFFNFYFDSKSRMS